MFHKTTFCLTLTALATASFSYSKPVAQKNNQQAEETIIDAGAIKEQIINAYNQATPENKEQIINQISANRIYAQGIAAGLEAAANITKNCQPQKGMNTKELVTQKIEEGAQEAEQAVAVFTEILETIETQNKK